MPVIDVPVKEFTRHILHPFVTTRIQSIVQAFNLEEIIKNNIHIKYGFSTGSQSKDRHKNILIRDNRVDVEVELNMNPNSLKWEKTSFNDVSGYGYRLDQIALNRAIFMDPEVDLAVYLHEMPCSVSMTVNITVLSRTIAYTLMGMYYDMYSGEENTLNYIDFLYNIPIEKEILNRLHDLYKLRRFDTEKISFLGYLFTGSQGSICEQLNRQATKKEIILRRHRTQILQSVEMSGDKPQENADNNGVYSYTLSLTLASQFSRPNFYTMIYPITIMNNMIPVKHITGLTYTKNPHANNIDTIKSQVATATYDYYQNTYKHFEHPFVTPFYDEWRPPSNTDPRNYTQRPFWIIPVTLDETDDGRIYRKTTVPLIGDIVDHYRLHPIVEEIIGIQSCESYEPDCIFNIAVYKNNTPYLYNELGWDVDERAVEILSTNLSYRYHIVISEMIDLNFLNPKWRFLIDRYKDFFSNRNDNHNLDDIINGGDGDSHGDYISKRVLYANIIPVKAIQR